MYLRSYCLTYNQSSLQTIHLISQEPVQRRFCRPVCYFFPSLTVLKLFGIKLILSFASISHQSSAMKRIPGAFLVRQTFFHGGDTAFVPSSTSCSSLKAFISFNQAAPIQQSFSSLLTSSSATSELQLQSQLQLQLQFTDSATATATTVLTEQTKTFEAVAPDTNILIGFGIVFILTIIASYVWAEEVVPVSRTKLALSKKNGEVNQYLQELKQGSINTSINADADVDGQDGTTTATSTI